MKFVAVLLVFGLTAVAQDKPPVLEGSVVNSVTGVGIEGAKIVLSNGKEGFKESVTDAMGNFHISDIPPGDYSVLVQKTGFSSPPRVSRNPIASVFSLHVDAATNPPPLRLELIPPATLRGRVFGPDGKPAVKVQVALGPQYSTKTLTNEDGVFVFEHVPAGQISLMAFDKNVRTYFPAAIDPAFAELISVRSGADQGGYEIRLQTASVYRVRGIALDAAGKPLAHGIVSLSPDLPSARPPQFVLSLAGRVSMYFSGNSGGVQPAREPDAVIGKDGAFEFPSVREGNWLLRAEFVDDRGAALVSVRKDIDDIRIRLESPVAILGGVALSDGSPVPANTLNNYLTLTSMDGARNASGMTDDKTGALRIENVSPGRYRITATTLSPVYYVASVMVGDVDAMSQSVFLSDSSPPLRIVLKAGGRVTGNVEKGEGAKLLLIPQPISPGDSVRVYGCGAGGNFELTGLAPGDYYAIAVTHFDPPLKAGIESLRAIARDATQVRVEDGAVTSVQLKAPVDLP
jgi:hypothetical protein